MPVEDQLPQWIEALRAHLDAGDLNDLAPVALDEGTVQLPGAQAVHIMLADLAHLDALLADPFPSIDVLFRYRRLLEQFRRLRNLLSEHPTFQPA